MIALLVVLPLFVSVLLMVLRPVRTREIALGTSGITMLVSVLLLIEFNNQVGDQFAVSWPWLPGLGINFSMAVDGISLLLVLLTTVLTPFIILSSFSQQRPAGFYALVLLMEAALIGVFVARDGFLFYVFWEIALIPIWFICLLWGEAGSSKVVLKFFIYTLAGSLLMLIALVYLYLQTPAPHSFDWQSLQAAGRTLPASTQSFLFWALFAAFAIKMPVFPFHTWQPETYRTAPAQGSMLLSAIMLKMGVYGVIRWLIPFVPEGVQQWGNTALVLSIIGIVYASLIALVQRDFKRLIAYSSIAHVGMISAGIFTISKTGLQGAVIQMVSHGLIVFALFYIAEIVYERSGKRLLSDLGGMRQSTPVLASVFLIIVLGSIGLPLTSGFVGEFLLITSLVNYQWLFGAVAALTIILGAVYMLRGFQHTMLGSVVDATSQAEDLTLREKLILIPVVTLILWIGIFPASLLRVSEAAAANLLQLVENSNSTSQFIR